MKNVQNYFLLNRKVIGIKKDFFMLCLSLPPAHMESALFILYYPVEFGVTVISKGDISKLFSRRNLVFIATLSKKTILRIFPPVWGDMDKKRELGLINSFEGSAKVRNVRRAPESHF